MTGTGIDFTSDLREFSSYEEARAGFRWRLPELYNVTADVVERHRGDSRPALRAAQAGGSVEAVSFDHLAIASSRLAAKLPELGIGLGSRACTILPNGGEVAVIQLALLRVGAIV